MKLFVCSDIHSNIRALRSVLEVYDSLEVDGFVSLGDSVGYGPNPNECLELIFSISDAMFVLGNHDISLLDENERMWLNPEAKKAIVRTAEIIDDKYIEEISTRFHLEIEKECCLAVHSHPVHPGSWKYIYSKEEAMSVFKQRNFDVALVGHTHVPAVFGSDGESIDIEPNVAIRLDPDKRYIINPGSVGQPRDYDNRASSCLLDTEVRTVTFYRTGYDIEAELKDFLNLGFPAVFGERLLKGV